MGQALYRKYRSKTLSEVLGQEHITETLAQAIKNGRISHAYLFTGPRGVGKTSTARILAHEVNGLPYNHEDSHIDIIEIDAASNRGIDEIRDLREKVYMAPVAAKYKVYIIDEVHMLTTQAFNALLKTLEEPPEHAIFILATTEAHKLPETIISRTQRHIFKPAEPAKVIAHLKSIAKREGIKIDDAALELFATHGGGSFRDSVSLLDQAGSSNNKVTREIAEAMLGIPSDKAAASILEAVVRGDTAATLNHVADLQGSGYNAAMIAKQLSAQLRSSLIDGAPLFSSETQLQLMRDLLDVAPAHEPAKTLELALLRAIPSQTAPAAPAPAPRAHAAPAVPAPSASPQPETKASKPAAPKAKPIPKPTAEKVVVVEEEITVTPTSTETLDPAIWNDILNALKSKYNTLYGVMRMAVPEFTAGKMTLRFRFAFHQKRMNEAKHRKIVGDILKELTGQTIAIECLYDKEAQLSESPLGTSPASVPPPAPATPAVSPEELAAISNIFGGGELLES